MTSRPLVAVLVAVLAACGADDRAEDGSTLRSTYRDLHGTGVLERAPGEPLRDRVELAPAAASRRVLATIVQVTDVHVTDEESPLRAEVLDRLGDPFTSASRPQEALTTQVLAAAVPTIRAQRPDLVLVTGDLVDSSQTNELAWALTLLRGGRVTPDSGRPGYDGVQSGTSSDPYVYRPDVDAPRHPGLLAAAQRTVSSPGVGAPLLILPSNHDLEVQGVVAPTPRLIEVAIGDRKLVALSDAAIERAEDGTRDPGAIAAFLEGDRAGIFEQVPADAARLPVGAAVADELARASGLDPPAPVTSRRIGEVVVVAVDTAPRAGGDRAAASPAVVDGLRRALAAAGDAPTLLVAPAPLENTIGGDGLIALVAADPAVIAVVSGDTHAHQIVPRQTASGGYWDVRTASLIDFPQQARLLRVLELADGRHAIETVVLDHLGDHAAAGQRGLAGVARDLAYLDHQGGRVRGDAGRPEDRNARLYLAR